MRFDTVKEEINYSKSELGIKNNDFIHDFKLNIIKSKLPDYNIDINNIKYSSIKHIDKNLLITFIWDKSLVNKTLVVFVFEELFLDDTCKVYNDEIIKFKEINTYNISNLNDSNNITSFIKEYLENI